MTPSSRGLLLLAFLTLLPRAQAQQPSSDVDYAELGEAMQEGRKRLLKKVRDTCLPQLEQESRAFLKATIPTEVSLKLSESLGGSEMSDSISVYMDAECGNKEVCDTATVALELPRQNQPEPCKPTSVSLQSLSWSGAEFWRELKKDNSLVKVQAAAGRAFQLKKKRHRLQEIFERVREKGEHELEADDSAGCSIKPDSTRATCFPATVLSKESGDTEYNVTFDVQKKQGKWTLVPNSLSFQGLSFE